MKDSREGVVGRVLEARGKSKEQRMGERGKIVYPRTNVRFEKQPSVKSSIAFVNSLRVTDGKIEFPHILHETTEETR